MTTDFDLADPAALAAVHLRRRLRGLAAGQTEAFDLLWYEFGIGGELGGKVLHGVHCLPYLAVLLADLAWTRGQRAAHDGALPPLAPEAEEVKRVFRYQVREGRRAAMNAEQRTAVLAYLDALLLEVAKCLDLDEYAPSATLGREARHFIDDFNKVRSALAVWV
jgi:hypothetical protein